MGRGASHTLIPHPFLRSHQDSMLFSLRGSGLTTQRVEQPPRFPRKKIQGTVGNILKVEGGACGPVGPGACLHYLRHGEVLAERERMMKRRPHSSWVSSFFRQLRRAFTGQSSIAFVSEAVKSIREGIVKDSNQSSVTEGF